jgi:predicted outer membrane protein
MHSQKPGEELVRKVLLSMTVTSAVYFGSLMLPVFAQTREDAGFLDKAIETNAAQIEFGRMAESKAADPRVKAYAAMVVKDDTKALKRLQRDQDAARSDSTELSLEHRELRDHLSQLSGPDFDTAYLNAMIEEQRKDVQEFEREANSSGYVDSISDSDTVRREKPEPVTQTSNKAMAQELLPTVKMHLKAAENLQQDIGPLNPQDNQGADTEPHQ